jgi:uncharacterized lipoprotein YmbA
MKNWFSREGPGLKGSVLPVALACAMLLGGCGSTPAAKYYMLSAARDSAPAAGAAVLGNKVIGLGPVVLPEYLDRPQIVIRASSNRLELTDGHRWAEPLADNFSSVLQENLSAMLGTDRILSYSSGQSGRSDYQIIVHVIRFDGGADGIVSLVARWSVVARDGTLLLPARRSSFDVTPSGTDIEALVAAQSEAVAQLSREIAAALRSR